MSGADFHRGAPLSVPMNAATLRLGHDRLLRLADAARRPVGLENLALAYGPDDVHRQGEFLDALLEPVDGFLILDLHNLFCQAHNFSVDACALLEAYPLHRVRELHLAGGSWEDSDVEPGRRIRRDTHSDRVPEEVFALLDYALPRCPHAQLAVLEQMSGFVAETHQVEGFQADFRRLRERLSDPGDAGHIPSDTSASAKPVPEPLHDEALYAEQRCLVEILTTTADATDAAKRLRAPPLADSDWGVETWDASMVETALRLVRKWA